MAASPDTIHHGAGSGSTSRGLSLGRVALTVHDLDGVRSFYEQTVGLHLLRRDGETAELGVGNDVLVELRRDPSARRRSPREAGLFHTAFLLPARADLGQWVRHAAAIRAPLVDASDHAVSEALYLSDPEGNGIEIYADRPASRWRWKDGMVEMPSDPLDVADLAASAGDGTWSGFPEGASVGHVHLQVGAIAPAEAFYAGVLGLAITCRYPGGTFYAADGYHHHIATNIWNSRGAGERSYPSTGLAEIQIRLDPARTEAVRQRAGDAASVTAAGITLRDPWGTPVALVLR
ncbi:VOC family protein [Bosea minatitlanensis]|uniref:VOC family protein n=1 Tax=Bosea minatitlanensis TaxID=128782 RepID=A0ABW0F2J7_9HYPH|nr:VOC family protein [Bosea minatitlanensis]MCT4494029.1 VOC family protein [Bosea minatitlanensis]